MKRYFLPTGAFFGFLSVMFGAFGAHYAKMHLTFEMFEVYKTATLYLFLHALTLLAIGALILIKDTCFLALSGRMILGGAVLFSGSLYLYVFTGNNTFAHATPFGGGLLALGWFLLFINMLRFNMTEG